MNLAGSLTGPSTVSIQSIIAYGHFCCKRKIPKTYSCAVLLHILRRQRYPAPCGHHHHRQAAGFRFPHPGGPAAQPRLCSPAVRVHRKKSAFSATIGCTKSQKTHRLFFLTTHKKFNRPVAETRLFCSGKTCSHSKGIAATTGFAFLLPLLLHNRRCGTRLVSVSSPTAKFSPRSPPRIPRLNTKQNRSGSANAVPLLSGRYNFYNKIFFALCTLR